MTGQPSDDPYATAQCLLARLHISSIPTPVEKIARAVGARLRFSPLDTELSGMVYIKDGLPIIGVNSLHHPNRQRFTIAHELGHLELHRGMITASVHVDKQFPALMRDAKSTSGIEPVEIEANKFAAALLIPRKQLDQVLTGKQFDIDDEKPLDELAKKFRVSRLALEYRIRNFY